MQFKAGFILVLAMLVLLSLAAEAQNGNNCPNGRRRNGRRARIGPPPQRINQNGNGLGQNNRDELRLNQS